MSWKAKKTTPPAVDEEELQITLGLRKDPAVEFLEASNLKHVLESLVEAACSCQTTFSILPSCVSARHTHANPCTSLLAEASMLLVTLSPCNPSNRGEYKQG